MRHALAMFLFFVVLVGLFTLALGDEPPPTPSSVAGESAEQVARGRELYRLNCAVCHGATALGFDEARSAFPKEHRHCERCHKPSNARTFDQRNIIHNNMFSLGTPPALRGEETLHALKDANALFNYVRATMPRYAPGRLTDAEYLDVTAFLLALRGAPPRETVTNENAATFLLP